MISIESSIFRALLLSDDYVQRVYPFLTEEFFDEGVHGTLFRVYKKLYDKYKTIPTLEALAVTINNEKIPESEFDELIEFVGEIYDNKDDLPNIDWLVDETETYCRDKALYKGVYEAINIIEGSNTKLDKHAIPDMLEAALSISFDSDSGMEFFDDAEKRYEMYTAEDSRIKFPIEALNRLSGGGHKKSKVLSAILASTNVGKSTMMCYLAGEFLKAGLNVAYITLEMAEEDVHQRVEANILSTKTSDIEKMTREEYLGKIKDFRSRSRGKLFVKQYPTSAAHAGHFRHYLSRELEQKHKVKIDFVFIDYINICASSRYRSMNGVNSYSYIKAIAEELRGLAVELDVPIMTATQVNREGSAKGSNVDMTSTSESFGLPATLDWFIAISQDEVLQDNNQQRVVCLKTRWSNKSKLKPELVGVNFDLMRYTDVGSVQEMQSTVGQRKPERKKKQIEFD